MELLSQEAHCLLGVASVSLPMAITGGILWGIIGMFSGLAYMAIKEFTFDIWIEGDSISDGWRDLLWFSMGVLGSWILILTIGGKW